MRKVGLVITNHGVGVAEDFEFSLEPVSGTGAEGSEVPMVIEPAVVRRFAPASPLRYPLVIHMGTALQVEIVMRWREGDQRYETSQTLRI